VRKVMGMGLGMSLAPPSRKSAPECRDPSGAEPACCIFTVF